MSITTATGTVVVPWFVALVATVLVIAIVSKSMLANIALIATAVLGIDFSTRLEEGTTTFSYFFLAIMVCLIAFALFQMVGRTESI